MCGIAGLFDPRPASPRLFDESVLRRMTDSISHRGPDASGIFIEPHIALGHRRLSIIDIATGQQPMGNEDGSVVVSFNGEIYNFQELVPELEKAGHVFRTRSDTEVIVHGWEEWGKDCVSRFRGMFAFAIWDRKRRTLFLARDRLGVKPIYYGWLRDGAFAFGSELKCLTGQSTFDRVLDDCAVEDYFALGYVPDPRTIYRSAQKLPPGHVLTLRVGDPEARVERFWDVDFEPDGRITLEDASAQLRELISESVRIRMLSEVPLGAFLSGGVDSSAVVAAMSRVSTSPIKTCSIGFNEKGFDESEYATLVARRYRTEHRSQIVDLDDFGLIDRMGSIYDEPFADSSALPTYRVCELARREVTVALSGDGGDETFGGYRRYRLHLMEERLRSILPLGIRRGIFGPLGGAYPKLDWAPRIFRGKTTFQALGRSSVDAYFHSVSILREEDRDRLRTPEFERRIGGYRASEVFHRHAARAPTDQPLAQIQYIDYQTYLPGDINTKVDRASMAHSLEVREPLMDHRLIEWAAKLPQSLKVSGGETKRVFKHAMEPWLDREVLYRQKMGFAVPLADWFRGPLRGRLEVLTANPPAILDNYLRRDVLRQMVTQHTAGQRDWSAPLWAALVFANFGG